MHRPFAVAGLAAFSCGPLLAARCRRIKRGSSGGFSDFKQVGGLTLPNTWTVRDERSGNSVSEWKYDLGVQSVDEARTPTIKLN